MPLVVGLVYVGFASGIGTIIWRQERRQDRQAQILGLAVPGREYVGILAIVLSSAIVAVCPTLIVWMLLP
jgi:hypothetical protein